MYVALRSKTDAKTPHLVYRTQQNIAYAMMGLYAISMPIHLTKYILWAFIFSASVSRAETSLTYNAASENLTQLLLKYQVTDDYIKLGEVYLKNSNVGLKIENNNYLSAYWPSEVFRNGKIELIKNNGDVLFSQNVTEKMLQTYTINTNDDWRNNYHNVKVLIPIQDTWLNEIKVSGGIFFCLKNKKPNGYLEICSSPYKLSKNQLLLSSKNSSTKVLLNGPDSQPLEAEVPIESKARFKTQWFAQLQSGLSWAFEELPPTWKLIEIVEVDQEFYRVSGLGPRPLKYFTDHFTYKDHPFFYEYKRIPLLTENEEFWSVNIQASKSIDLNFMNPNGGIYTARIKVADAPKLLQSPIIIDKNLAQLTYSAQNNFVVSLSPDSKLMTKKNVILNKDGTKFKWRLEHLKKGRISTNTITTKIGDQPQKSYFLETYRGYSVDLGVQYTVSTIAGNTTHGNEFHGSYWTEDFWGLGNYDWLRLRLGFQIKYFKPSKKIPIKLSSSGDAKKEVDVSSSTVDIKYRFQPGLWGRDETLGIMLAHHQLTFDEYKLSLLGAGVFWARSMPKLFDQLFNYIPFFRYPKWVNAELINFFYNSNSEIKLKNTYHLNFYGKINWTETFYGDLGFGLRSYSFSDNIKGRDPLLDLMFLTMGLGFAF